MQEPPGARHGFAKLVRRRFPPEEQPALQMIGRLTTALPMTLRVHLLEAEHDCASHPVDLAADLKVPLAFHVLAGFVMLSNNRLRAPGYTAASLL